MFSLHQKIYFVESTTTYTTILYIHKHESPLNEKRAITKMDITTKNIFSLNVLISNKMNFPGYENVRYIVLPHASADTTHIYAKHMTMFLLTVGHTIISITFSFVFLSHSSSRTIGDPTLPISQPIN